MSSARRAYLTIVPATESRMWTDRELVAALVAGDRQATVQAWREYAPRVFGIVERTMGLAPDAEDITQDIFMRVFARVHTLRDPEAFGSFVFSVALRVIKSHLRNRRVRKILHLADPVPDLPIPGLDMDARRTLRRFYEILDSLPANERVVFALRHIEGMTMAEIAQVTGSSLSTSKRRLRRATERIIRKTETDPHLSRYASRIIGDGE